VKDSVPDGPDLDWRRTAAWVAGLVLLAWLACFRFPVVWVATGIGEANRPFMDLYGLLAASDAARAGVDPFLPNSFDPYHRPHVYTEWWLELGRLGLGRADTPWVGAALLVAVLVTALVMVRPRTARQGSTLLLLLVSPAFLMAVNRANNDLVVFVLISGGLLCFRRDVWPVRTLGVVLFAVSAVLKYYPLLTLVVLWELRSRRAFVAGLALYVLVLVLAWPGLEPGLKSAARFISQPEWLYAYGAPVLLRNIGVASTISWLVPAGLMTLWAGWSAWKKMGTAPGTPPDQTTEREFMVGAAMLIGMFFLGSSFVYKLVFTVWLLPWLWQEPPDPAEARWRRAIRWLLLAVVWFEGAAAVGLNLVFGPQSPSLALGLLKAALLVSQLLTWAWVACLLRLLLGMLGRRFLGWWRDIGPAPAGGRA
jgi:hypothetical protein